MVFECLNISFIILPLIALGMRSGSKCSGTAFGKTVAAMSVILMIQGVLGICVHAYLFYEFTSSGKVSLCGMGGGKSGKQSATKVQPEGGLRPNQQTETTNTNIT